MTFDLIETKEDQMTCDLEQCEPSNVWNVSSNFSCYQRLTYCRMYAESVNLTDIVALLVNVSFSVGGPIGLISYVLMIVSLRYMPLNTSSRIYHTALAAAELLHMAVMTVAGVISLNRYSNSKSYAYVVWSGLLANGWQIGDPMKLTVSTITVFISVERCIAGFSPSWYRKIKTKPIAYLLTVVAFLIGLLNMYFVYLGRVAPTSAGGGGGGFQLVLDRQSYSFNVFVQIINVLKIVFSVVVLCNSAVLVVRLRIQAKRMTTITGSQRSEGKANLRLITFCLCTSIIMIVDHISWAVSKITTTFPDITVGPEAMTLLDYNRAIYGVSLKSASAWARIVQALIGVLAHSGRLFVYFAVNKTYRNALARVFNGQSGKLTTLAVIQSTHN